MKLEQFEFFHHIYVTEYILNIEQSSIQIPSFTNKRYIQKKSIFQMKLY